MKFTDDSLPETLLQSPPPPPQSNSSPTTENDTNTNDTSKPPNFDEILSRIKEFHSKLDMDALKGKSIEMFVCNICYEIHARKDLLRDHYVSVSDCLIVHVHDVIFQLNSFSRPTILYQTNRKLKRKRLKSKSHSQWWLRLSWIKHEPDRKRRSRRRITIHIGANQFHSSHCGRNCTKFSPKSTSCRITIRYHLNRAFISFQMHHQRLQLSIRNGREAPNAREMSRSNRCRTDTSIQMSGLFEWMENVARLHGAHVERA